MKAINTMKSKTGSNLFIRFKQMQRILIASLFTISMILVPWGTATAQVPPSNAVKWHPGHYISMVGDGKYNPDYMTQVYSELQQTPAIRGVMVRYAWGELEKAKDVYDFSNIKNKTANFLHFNRIQQSKSFIKNEQVNKFSQYTYTS